MSEKFPRKSIRESIMYVLSQKGMTIGEIQDSETRRCGGDESQIAFQDKHCWYSRTVLIESVAEILRIDQKWWGRGRVSNRFHNIMDKEIVKLRTNGTIVDWNRSRHLGVFRLAQFPDSPLPKPQPSMEGEIPTHARGSTAMDVSSANLKQKFLSIISKSAKSNTYKFTLAKSLLDYCQENSSVGNKIHEIPYEYFAGKFLRYYWYQEYKFKMKQDFHANRKPKVIKVINEVFGTNPPGDFELLDGQKIQEAEKKILKTVFGSIASKTSIVVPAFQEIPTGRGSEEIRVFYDYDSDKKMIYLKPEAFDFFRKNNGILSKAVLAEWAKFLEKTNPGLPRLVAKIEQEDMKREPLLSEYWRVYFPHSQHCFYCCTRLERSFTNVDHFIPWSYIFDNNAWNLVLACKDCNCKKSDSLPKEEFLDMLIRRNKRYSPRIRKLKTSLDQLNSGRGWKPEIENYYTNCNSYGFSTIQLP